MVKKFYVVGNDDYGVTGVWLGYGCQRVNTLPEADIVILTGGVDVQPALYSERPHRLTQRSNGRRDELEMNAYYEAINLGKNIFGVCRGAQLIHVLNGNKLWQHVDNHVTRGHEVRDLETGKTHFVSSCHHQMMKVERHPQGNEEYKIIAVASESSSRETPDVKIKTKDYYVDDIEVLWYPRVRSICYQSHPEFGIKTDTAYARELQVRYGFLDNDTDSAPPAPVIATPPDGVLMSRLSERIFTQQNNHARMHAN